MMKFYPIPDARTAPVTPEMLTDLVTANIIPHNIGAFATTQQFLDATGVAIPPQEGTGAKFWRDNATVWRPNVDQFPYVMLDRNPDGTIFRMPLDFSDMTWNYYSNGTANFYRQYAKHFPVIPRLVKKVLNRFDAGRMNFSDSYTVDYPLGIITDDPPLDGGRPFPSNMALRFSPQTGRVEAFYWDQYVREYPIDWSVTVPAVPGSVSKLSDVELVNAVTGLLAARMPVKDTASAIRQLATK